MKSIRLICAAAVLALLACTAAAQPQRQQGRQNRMQQMGNVMLQQALADEAAQSDPLQMIYRKDVQLYLGLDLGQRNKLDNFHDEQARDLQQSRIQNRRNQAAVNQLLEKQKKNTQAKIDELLTADQKASLAKLALQFQGNMALFNAGLQKEVGINSDQVEQLNQIRGQRQVRLEELKANISTGATSPQEVRSALKQIEDDINSAIDAILTDDQRLALKKAFGKPFKPSSS